MGRPRKPAPMAQRLFIATESFSGQFDDGARFQVNNNQTLVWEPHELLDKYPQWFRLVDAHFGERREMETAEADRD